MARFTAPEAVSDYVPAFVIEKLEGTYVHNVTKYIKGKLTNVPEERPRGYLVHFAKGHKTHVTSEDELERLGLNTNLVPMVDPSNDGDWDGKAVSYVPNKIIGKDK